MKKDKQTNLHEDQMSDIRSLGSNYQRCSQPRKMSISIAANLSANMSNCTGNRHNAKGQKGSPWISPKLLIGKTLDESAKKKANITAVDGAYSNVGSMNGPMAGTYSQSGNVKKKKVDIPAPEKGNRNDGTSERDKGSTQKHVEEVSVPNEGIKQHKLIGNKRKETFSMKLWEILRTAPPINKELDVSRTDEVDANAMMQKIENRDGPMARTYSQSGNVMKKKVDIQAPGKGNRNDGTSERDKDSTQKHVEEVSVPNQGIKQHKLWEVLRTTVDGAYSNVGSMNGPMAGTYSQSGNVKKKKVDIPAPEKGNRNDGTSERDKGSTQKHVEEVSVPNEGIKQHKLIGNKRKETLKMKLWEALRTASPINKELDVSRSDEVDANVMMQKIENKDDISVKPRVNSDTIETDSENPELAVSRPVTRSFTRKRGPVVVRPKRLRKKLFPANEENNVFSFGEMCHSSQYVASGKNLQSKTNSSGKRNIDIRTDKTGPPPRMSNIQLAGSKRSSKADEISLRSGLGIACGYQDQGRKKQAVQIENSCSTPETNDNGELGKADFVVSPEKGGKNCHLTGESAPKIANLISDLFGPANKMKANAQLPIPSSSQAKETENPNYTQFLAKRIIFVKDAFRYKSTLSAEHIKSGSRLRAESSNGPVGSDDTTQSMREKHDAELFSSGKQGFDKTEEELSVSNGSVEDKDNTSKRANHGECSPILPSPNVSVEYNTPEADLFEKQASSHRKQVDITPRSTSEPSSPSLPKEVPTVEDSGDDTDSSPNVSHAEKLISPPSCHDTHEAVNYNDLSPAFCSLLATKLTEASQEHQEDGLERAIALFGCALENFKNKLLSSTKKKSSEILESTEREIHSKYQSAKTQVEKDVAKLTISSKSKRQIIEKKFNEQQEQLQLIHNKFKTEIQRHLEDFTKTVESLEAHGNELEEVIERRKTLHQKLIVQVEEAVENHLSDAQKSLISIQSAGKSKMQHLKTAIVKCLEGGIFA